MSAPNLFSFATSELSQDAVLAWLLAWADPVHKADPVHEKGSMHAVGSAFLGSLLALSADEHVRSGAVTSVNVRRQAGRVDVRADVWLSGVDRPVAVLIEDKVLTGVHDDQLNRYLDETLVDTAIEAVVPVYLTTHNAAELPNTVGGRWVAFERSDLLRVLTSGAARHVRNDILDAFREHLTRIEAESAAYATTDPGAWNAAAWRGYFTALTAEIGTRTPAEAVEPPSWSYVPNKAGGFWALWWGVATVPDGWLYLQLEGKPATASRTASALLSFRVRCGHGETAARRDFRKMWHRRLSDAADAAGFGVSAPSRFGSGAAMTVAVASGDRAWCGAPEQDAVTLVDAWHVAAAAARLHR